MAENLVKLLEQFVRDKAALRVSEQRLAQRERRLIQGFRELLPRMGYRVVPGTGRGPEKTGNTLRRVQPAKRLRCPTCDRHFNYPHHLARHVNATHRARSARRAGKGAVKKKAS